VDLLETDPLACYHGLQIVIGVRDYFTGGKMERKIMALLMALTMFALFACSLFTVDETPTPTEIVQVQAVTLPIPTVMPASPTQQPTSAPAPTSAPVVPPQDDCLLWSEVTSAMTGEYKCVHGNLVSTYLAEKGTYLRFSDKATSFYFIYLYMGNIFFYYPDLKLGDCVQAYGTILAFQGVQRIEISGRLDYCD
jgi:hypothetical protein